MNFRIMDRSKDRFLRERQKSAWITENFASKINRFDYDVAIIGAGPSAFVASNFTFKHPTIIFKQNYDEIIERKGKSVLIEDLKFYPGFKTLTTKSEYANILSNSCKAHIHSSLVMRIERLENGTFRLLDEYNEWYRARVIIIATGTCKERDLFPGTRLNEHWNRGVYDSVITHGHKFVGKRVAVIGNNNTAVKQALHLARLGCQVHIIFNEEKPCADEIFQTVTVSHPQIFIHKSWKLVSVSGIDKVEYVSVALKSFRILKKNIDVDGVFLALETHPNTAFLKEALSPDIFIELDPNGFVITDNLQNTTAPGILACGSVCKYQYEETFAHLSSASIAGVRVCQLLDKWV